MRIIQIYIALLFFCISSVVWGQVPSAFSYEGIATDPFGIPIADRDIAILIEIESESSPNLNPLYAEKHKVMTSPIGKFSVAIGRGQKVSGGDLIDVFRVSERRFGRRIW